MADSLKQTQHRNRDLHSPERIADTAEFISDRAGLVPETGLILGTGLSRLADAITDPVRLAYADIPNFPVSTVQSHKGELIIGRIAGHPVAVMAGRFHYYEGYSMKEVTFPVRVLKALGIKRLVLSNASGGVSSNVSAGDICVLADHISLFPENPLRGPNDESLGPRFPDLVDAYDRHLIRLAKKAADAVGFPLQEVVYVGVPGPNLETRAEFNFFHVIGADVVGMSTIPEVIVARHAGLPVLAFSVVTNEGRDDDRKPAPLDEIIAVSESAEPKLEALVTGLLKSFND